MSDYSPIQLAALEYTTRAWPVFPCRGKVPLNTNGVLGATCSSDAVRSWWLRWPTANIGVATGPQSFWVLDVDADTGGFESLRDLRAAHGELPDTLVALTGGGGEHYFFQYPKDTVIRNRARVNGMPGLDVRGAGGYIIAPPSIHPDTGRAYNWDVLRSPRGGAIYPAPEWLLRLIEYHPPASDRIMVKEKVISIGERNDTLFRDACCLRDKGYGKAALEAFLHGASVQCEAPMLGDELELILNSVLRYDPTAPKPAGVMPDIRRPR